MTWCKTALTSGLLHFRGMLHFSWIDGRFSWIHAGLLHAARYLQAQTSKTPRRWFLEVTCLVKKPVRQSSVQLLPWWHLSIRCPALLQHPASGWTASAAETNDLWHPCTQLWGARTVSWGSALLLPACLVQQTPVEHWWKDSRRSVLHILCCLHAHTASSLLCKGVDWFRAAKCAFVIQVWTWTQPIQDSKSIFETCAHFLDVIKTWLTMQI